MFNKKNMDISTKIYFSTDPQLSDRDEIIITKRKGVAVPSAEQVALRCIKTAGPDASAGLGVLFRVYCSDMPGSRS